MANKKLNLNPMDCLIQRVIEFFPNLGDQF